MNKPVAFRGINPLCYKVCSGPKYPILDILVPNVPKGTCNPREFPGESPLLPREGGLTHQPSFGWFPGGFPLRIEFAWTVFVQNTIFGLILSPNLVGIFAKMVGGVPRLFDKIPEGFCQVDSTKCCLPKGLLPRPEGLWCVHFLVHTC